jgi:predicted PurR-regulated permease PerM
VPDWWKLPPMVRRPGATEPPSARDWRADRWILAGARVWTAVGVLILAWLLARLLRPLLPLLISLLFAAVPVYLLDPVVTRLERRGVPRMIGTALAVAGLAVLVAAGGFLFVPRLTGQLVEAVGGLPTSVAQADEDLQSLVDSLGLGIDVRLDGAAIQGWLVDPENREILTRSVAGIGTATVTVLRGLLLAVLGPVVAVYVLADLPRIRRGLLHLVPTGRRGDIAELTARCASTVGAYLRGQLLVALFVGVASSVALWAIDLRYWLLVGTIAGVTNLVPFVGPIVGGALAMVIALLTGSPVQAVWAGLVILIVQQLESHLVAPLVVGRVVHLPPLVVLLAVLVGAVLSGLLGMLVAVPIAACIRVVLEHYRERLR